MIGNIDYESCETVMGFLRELVLYAKLRTLAYYVVSLSYASDNDALVTLRKTMEEHIRNILYELAKIEHSELMVDLEPEVLGKFLMKKAIAKVVKR